MKKLVFFFIFVSACVSNPTSYSKRAPASEPNLPDLKTVEDSAPYIISRAKLTDPETAKMAYVGRAAYIAYYQAYYDQNVNKDPATIQRRVEQAIDTARTEVNGSDWLARYSAAAAKSALKGVSLATKASGEFAWVGWGLEAAEPITDQVIEDVKKSLIRPGMTPSTDVLDDHQVLALSVWMYNEAQNSKSMFAKAFGAEIETRHHVQPTRNLNTTEIVQRDSFNKEILNQLAKEGLDIKSMLGGIHNIEEFQKTAHNMTMTGLIKIKGDTNEIVNYMRADRKAQVKEANRVEMRSNVTGPFEAMSALATLGGDYKTAAVLGKTAKLSGAIYDIATKAATNSFSKAPFAVVNPYLLAATMAVDLVGGLSGGGSEQAMFEMLKAIQMAIEKLREEMHERFDRLEYRIDRQFANVYMELTSIKINQQLAAEQLKSLADKLDVLEQGQRAGFNAVLKILMSDPVNKCLSSRGNSVSLDELDGCRDKFSYVSMGELDGALKIDPREDKFSNGFSSMRTVQATIRASSPQNPLARMKLVDPLHWIWGSRWLEAMVRIHPEYRSEIAKPNFINGDQVDLTSVIAYGENLRDFLKGMAFENGKLNISLFRSLFENYRKSVDQVLGVTDAKMADEYRSGPRSANFGAKFPELDSEKDLKYNPSFTFVNNDLHMCVGEKPTFGGGFQHDFTRKNDGERMANIVNFNRGIRMHQNLVKLLPGSVAWALKLHHLDANLRGCFRKIHFSDLDLVRYPNGPFSQNREQYFSVKMEAELELYFTYNIGSETKSFMAARLSGKYDFRNDRAWDPMVGAGLTHVMWMGGQAGQAGDDPNFPNGANQNPNNWLKNKSVDADDAERLRVFEREYSELFSEQKEHVDSEVSSSVASTNNDAAKARRAIQFAVDYGLKSNGKALENLRTWLAEPTNLPDAIAWARAMNSSGAQKEEVRTGLINQIATGTQLLQAVAKEKDLTFQPDIFESQLKYLRGLHLQ